jgi:uncharacterized protein involved in cysteine biosynthesis
MLKAFIQAIEQLPETDLIWPLLLTLGWTVIAFGGLWLGGFEALRHWIPGWHGYESLGLVAWIVVFGGLTWLLFVAVENAILFCFANRIIRAVERRYYPDLPETGSTRHIDLVWSAVRLLLMTIVGNLAALPIYLLVPGANLVLFLVLNGYLLGRAYFDAVALRRMEDRSARLVWRAHRLEFVLTGAASIALLTIPVVNLVVPVVGLAMSVHLFERLRPD